MSRTNLRAGLTVLVIGGVVITLVIQQRARTKLREENASLRRHIAQLQADDESLSNRVGRARSKSSPRLPAPPLQVATSTNVPLEDLPLTNLYVRFKDNPPKLTVEQVEAYLRTNGRNASTLLAAYRTSGNPALLREAMQKYPRDAQVAFEAAFDKELSPDEQRQWLNALEQSAPDNSLANYLSARNYFQSGQSDQAVQELNAAAGKQQFQSYTLDRWIDDEEAYLSAGYSEAEAKYLATSELHLPQLAPMKQLGQDLVDLANAYRQSGDPASAQVALQMAMDLGQRYVPASAGDALVSQLVGLVIQRNALGAMDPNSPYGDSGQTVRDQFNRIEQQRAALQELGRQAGSLLEKANSDRDWINYVDRWMIFGDLNAARWMVNKYGQQ